MSSPTGSCSRSVGQLRAADLTLRAFQQLVHEDHFYATEEDRRARLRYGAVLADEQHVTDGYPFGGDSEHTVPC